MAVHFEYMSVTIGYMAAGIPVWNGVFLADANWCVPGMAKGGLLPPPDAALQEGHGPLAFGLPIALIVVRNLTISVKWSGQEKAALGDSGGFLGPFSLAGASADHRAGRVLELRSARSAGRCASVQSFADLAASGRA